MKIKSIVLSVWLLVFSSSSGEIKINNLLSLEGFADTSYTYLDKEDKSMASSGADKTDEAFSLEEVEVSLLLGYKRLSARIDVEYEDGDNSFDIEQVFADYRFKENFRGSVITMGRYSSMLGFEADEPTGLYQYSNAYGGILGESIGSILAGSASNAAVARDPDFFVFLDSALFPVSERYSQGIKYAFEDEDSFFGISFQDSMISYDNRLRGDDDADDEAVDDAGYGFEIAYAQEFMRILTFFFGGAYEFGENFSISGTSIGDTETYILNTYLTCQLGAWLLAAEFNYSETRMNDFLDSGSDVEIGSITSQLMANYAYNEKASITGRLSYMDIDADFEAGVLKSDGYALKYTVAHNYALTSNLFLVTEFNYLDGAVATKNSTDGDLEEILLAAELLFTF